MAALRPPRRGRRTRHLRQPAPATCRGSDHARQWPHTLIQRALAFLLIWALFVAVILWALILGWSALQQTGWEVIM